MPRKTLPKEQMSKELIKNLLFIFQLWGLTRVQLQMYIVYVIFSQCCLKKNKDWQHNDVSKFAKYVMAKQLTF